MTTTSLTPSLSEVTRFIDSQRVRINNKAFRDWQFQEENAATWLAVLASAGHIFTVYRNNSISGVAMIIPLAGDNEFHVAQLLTTHKDDIEDLYRAFKRQHPAGQLMQAHRRGRIIKFKCIKRMIKHVTKNKYIYGK